MTGSPSKVTRAPPWPASPAHGRFFLSPGGGGVSGSGLLGSPQYSSLRRSVRKSAGMRLPVSWLRPEIASSVLITAFSSVRRVPESLPRVVRARE